MALSQLQGLTPLGGGSGYGRGQPPNGDGTDPNQDPNAAPHMRRPQNTGAPSSSPAPGASAPPPTFSQMSQQGRARPAPPAMQQGGQMQAYHQPMTAPVQNPSAQGGLSNQVNQAASQALSNPSAYGSQQVQDTYKMLNQSLGQDYDYQRKQLNDEMAKRGLSDSTIAGQRYSDLSTEQARAQANMATQLATQAAQTYGQDRSTALQNASNVQNQGVNQALGYAGLTGNLNGQSTLAAQQLGMQGSQFDRSLGLQQQLGTGQLGVAQQQANTQQAGTMGQLGLGQQQLQQQGSQFGQTFGLSQLQNQQQYGLAQQNFGLQQQLGQGQLGVQQGQLNLANRAQDQNYGLQSMGLAQNQAYQQGQLGLGQSQINASLINQQRQQVGNLLYGGLTSGALTAADMQGGGFQSWLDSITNNQGQNSSPLYQLPSWASAPGSNTGGGNAPPNYGNLPQRPQLSFGAFGAAMGRNQSTPGTGSSVGSTLGYGTGQITGVGDMPPQDPSLSNPQFAMNNNVSSAQSAQMPSAPAPSNNPYGLDPRLAASLGITTSTGQTPLMGDQYIPKGQTQQQAASQYQQNAMDGFNRSLVNGNTSPNTPGLSNDQYNTAMSAIYNQSLKSNLGDRDHALQALNAQVGVDPSDPRYASFLKMMGYA